MATLLLVLQQVNGSEFHKNRCSTSKGAIPKCRAVDLCLLQQYKWTTIKIRLTRLIINAIYYIHTEKYSPKSYVVNFRTQISSSQSEERTMFSHVKKMIRPIRIANDVFSRVRKMTRPIRSHRGV